MYIRSRFSGTTSPLGYTAVDDGRGDLRRRGNRHDGGSARDRGQARARDSLAGSKTTSYSRPGSNGNIGTKRSVSPTTYRPATAGAAARASSRGSRPTRAGRGTTRRPSGSRSTAATDHHGRARVTSTTACAGSVESRRTEGRTAGRNRRAREGLERPTPNARNAANGPIEQLPVVPTRESTGSSAGAN